MSQSTTGEFVFIVGAGASADFGLPLGRKLVETIRQSISHDLNDPYSAQPGPLLWFMLQGGLTEQRASEARELADGLMLATSIDEIIGYRPELSVVGKVAIAFEILKGEQASGLNKLSDRNSLRESFEQVRSSWIGELLRRAIGPRKGEDAVTQLRRCAFVIFNYDRCFELVLSAALQLVANLTEQQAIAAINDLAIHHIYGSLGPLPGFGNSSVKFGEEWRFARRSPDELKTFTESFVEGEFATVQRLLADARKIISIGYGFGQANNERLFPNGYPTDIPIFGAMGNAPPWQVEDVRAYCGGKCRIGNHTGAQLFDAHGHEIWR